MLAAAVLPAGAVETVTFNQVEVRKWGTGAAEVITTYPHPNIRLIWTRVGASTNVEAQALHRDQLGSVRAVTTFKPLTGEPVGNRRVEAAIYKPFGEQTETLRPTQVNPEQKGWIGQRYDADAGLQYLNARYYDPEYGFFLQPDWFEVTAAGVGTNRYSYSFNDPVNMRDPGGNAWYNDWDDFKSAFSGNTTTHDDGSVEIRSAEILRTFVPGQVAWDNARTNYANGDLTSAAINTTQMVGETALTAMTMGIGTAGAVGATDIATVAAPGAVSLADDLAAAASQAVQQVGAGSGPAYGTRVHSAFEAIVKALPGRNVTTEISYLNGQVVARGTPGSVRLDVASGLPSAPSAIYDLKTGTAALTAARVREIQRHVSGGMAVPVYEIRP